MFTYFNRHKCRYNKGQMTPYFIVFIALLVIMAFATVNLSKISFTKTDTANAVDAGALAGGSVMANVFNAVAQANSQLEVAYWQFYATVSVSFMFALTMLALATQSASSALAAGGILVSQGASCYGSCTVAAGLPTVIAAIGKSIASLKKYLWTMAAISLAVTAFHIAQHYFYLIIRDIAAEGREKAIEIAHQLAFSNSGIGSKLKPGDSSADLGGNQNNYQDSFSDFMDTLESNSYYQYSWVDGENRSHSVDMTVGIDPVDTYDLQVAVMPFLAEVALLLTAIVLGTFALTSLNVAASSYAAAKGYFGTACKNIWCCMVWPPAPCCPIFWTACAAGFTSLVFAIGTNASALTMMTFAFVPVIAAWAGLLPGYSIRSSSGGDALMFIIAWIDDIVHNRLVRVDTNQQHTGADRGLWKSDYPDTHSFSVVNFEGMGQIHPPVLRHDSSIVQTDIIGQ